MAKRTLTPVFDGAKDLPVRKGWYPTEVKDSEYPHGQQTNWPRRFWNGKHFSAPCLMRDTDSLEKCCRKVQSYYANSQLYWCGLTAPYES